MQYIIEFFTNEFICWVLLVYFGWMFLANSFSDKMSIGKFIVVIGCLLVSLYAAWMLFFR